MRKNVASQFVAFQMVSASDGSDVTAGTPAVYYTIEGGSQGTGSGAKVHEGNGQWSYAATQAETNGDHIVYTMVLATAISQSVNVYPSGISAAAEVNLELQYDETGLTGETFPATQAAVANIGAASGGAVNIEATEDNTGGAIIDSVAFVGTVTGATTYTNTESENGVGHTMDDDTNVIDIVYGFDVGGSRAATSVKVVANLNGNTDEILIKAYDHVSGSTWDTVGTLSGSGGASYTSLDLPLLTKHTGTGGELGKVYIRFDTDSTSPNSLDVDVCLVAAVSTSTSVGYADGAYWIDSAGTAGTEIGTNGTADNPCPMANALTMNGTQALNRFHVANGNTVTLAATLANMTMYGDAWTLALGGQSISGSHFQGAAVTGTSSGASPPEFHDCGFGATATVPPAAFHNCGFGGTFTAGGAGQYVFHHCYSTVAGTGSPVFVCTGLGSASGFNNRAWTGGATWTLDSDCTLSHEVLAGGGTTITTGGGTVEVRGITRSLTLVLSAAETVQFVGVTGPVTLSGTTTATVNLYGVAGAIADSTSAATVTSKPVTEARLAELDAANLPADVAAIPTTAMRGTDNAALAATALTDVTWTDARAGYLDAINGHTAQTGDTYALANGATGFAAIDTVVDNILVDTNELQADWTNGGRLDLLLDAIPTTAMRGTDSAATAANLATLDAIVDRIATTTIGTISGAGTGTEVFVYSGVTCTVTVDGSGNRSAMVFS